MRYVDKIQQFKVKKTSLKIWTEEDTWGKLCTLYIKNIICTITYHTDNAYRRKIDFQSGLAVLLIAYKTTSTELTNALPVNGTE